MSACASRATIPSSSSHPPSTTRNVRCRFAGCVPAGPGASTPVLKSRAFSIASIYVPAKRRATLDQAKVLKIAESILEGGQDTPILVREDGSRFVLVEG